MHDVDMPFQLRFLPAGTRLFLWDDDWDFEVSVLAVPEMVALFGAWQDGHFLGDEGEFVETMRILFQGTPPSEYEWHERGGT